ncbi:hypothetical protein RGF97_31005 [Streptomyces roseicoloratus]|uniref:Uncharacterized protein n=1 Tax=Streptomyces roseicoloratus TaxID=2508722 RepID=A0ABY9S843_9ACTN|nr:hypothetical protein [Streptomyces roseicoloratus]WMX49155.1 hypothetical protein RGF97_31005 [Streptomyces roseicoloratus]
MTPLTSTRPPRSGLAPSPLAGSRTGLADVLAALTGAADAVANARRPEGPLPAGTPPRSSPPPPAHSARPNCPPRAWVPRPHSASSPPSSPNTASTSPTPGPPPTSSHPR